MPNGSSPAAATATSTSRFSPWTSQRPSTFLSEHRCAASRPSVRLANFCPWARPRHCPCGLGAARQHPASRRSRALPLSAGGAACRRAVQPRPGSGARLLARVALGVGRPQPRAPPLPPDPLGATCGLRTASPRCARDDGRGSGPGKTQD